MVKIFIYFLVCHRFRTLRHCFSHREPHLLQDCFAPVTRLITMYTSPTCDMSYKSNTLLALLPLGSLPHQAYSEPVYLQNKIQAQVPFWRNLMLI